PTRRCSLLRAVPLRESLSARVVRRRMPPALDDSVFQRKGWQRSQLAVVAAPVNSPGSRRPAPRPRVGHVGTENCAYCFWRARSRGDWSRVDAEYPRYSVTTKTQRTPRGAWLRRQSRPFTDRHRNEAVGRLLVIAGADKGRCEIYAPEI